MYSRYFKVSKVVTNIWPRLRFASWLWVICSKACFWVLFWETSCAPGWTLVAVAGDRVGGRAAEDEGQVINTGPKIIGR